MSQVKPARTRIAPSPTGEYHVGHLRTCLYDYALAKKTNGQFIIRIEDTDQKRFVEGSMERTLQVIKDYHLSWDEGPDIGGPHAPYIQSQRLDIYQPYIQKLLDDGHAYHCFCTQERLDSLREEQRKNKQVPRYDQHCLHLSQEEVKKNLDQNIPHTIRLKVPKDETILFNDPIRGQIKFYSNDVDDQVLIKSNGIPTYHFAAVVDDHLMNITHVLRGEEWLSSTPKHLLLYRFLGWEAPIIIHPTVLLNPDGKGKLSKRHGATSAQSFLDDGYLPEAMLNFLMFLGWNPGTDQEFFTLDEFVKEFSLEKLHKKSPVFDRKKLDFYNAHYIRNSSDQYLLPHFKKFLPQLSDEKLLILIPIIKERLIKFSDLPEQLNFLFQDPEYDNDLLLKKGTSRELATEMLQKAKDLLSQNKDYSILESQEALLALIKDNNWNTGEFFMVFRVAICASAFTPPVVEMLSVLGQEKTLRKIDIALEKLSA